MHVYPVLDLRIRPCPARPAWFPCNRPVLPVSTAAGYALAPLTFTGIGSIHRVLVTLRSTDGGGLESAFHSEIKPGKWLHGTWEPAARCPG